MLPWQVPHPVVSIHSDGFMEYNKWYNMLVLSHGKTLLIKWWLN